MQFLCINAKQNQLHPNRCIHQRFTQRFQADTIRLQSLIQQLHAVYNACHDIVGEGKLGKASNSPEKDSQSSRKLKARPVVFPVLCAYLNIVFGHDFSSQFSPMFEFMPIWAFIYCLPRAWFENVGLKCVDDGLESGCTLVQLSLLQTYSEHTQTMIKTSRTMCCIRLLKNMMCRSNREAIHTCDPPVLLLIGLIIMLVIRSLYYIQTTVSWITQTTMWMEASIQIKIQWQNSSNLNVLSLFESSPPVCVPLIHVLQQHTSSQLIILSYEIS